MNSLKKFFYLTYAVVAIVILVILFLNIDLAATFGMEGSVLFWMIASLLILTLLTIGVIGDYVETRSLGKKLNALLKENTELKARLYEGITGKEKELVKSVSQSGKSITE